VSSGTQRGQGHFENVAATDRAGVEAALDASLGERFSTFAAWTFQRATFGADLRIASPFHPAADEDGAIDVGRGDRLPGVPAHGFKAGATAALGRARVGLSLLHQTAQTFRGDEANLLPRVPGFTLVHAQGRARLTSRLTAVVQAHNLFDVRFFTTGVLGASTIPGIVSDDPRFLSPGVRRALWVGVEIR
jgi:outer membrane receptor protein involved in Fe transport